MNSIDVGPSIERHLDAMPPEYLQRTMSGADWAGRVATDGFRDIDPKGITIMPVALPDEDKLRHTLDVLREHSTESWTLIGANATPWALRTRSAYRNLRTIRSYIRAHPQFPLGYFLMSYAPRTPIGMVRADAVNVGIEMYRRHCNAANAKPHDIMVVKLRRRLREYWFGRTVY